MNNYYQYSPYMGNNNPYMYQQNQPTQIPYNHAQQSQIQSQPSLYGKVVDNIETAKAQDVPIGLTGIYPSASGEAVYVKSWLPNGVTETKEYRLYEESVVKEEPIDWNGYFDEIYDRIDELSKKIDKINKPATTSMKRKAGADE